MENYIDEAKRHLVFGGLVYVAAHAPDVGEDEAALGKKTPSILAKTEGAIKKAPDDFTYLNPASFPSCSRRICRASGQHLWRALRGPGQGFQHTADRG